MSQFQFKRAARQAVKLKTLTIGPSGSGKTLGSLRVASAIAPGKVALIDSENDRSSYYADALEFDSLSLSSHKPDDYINAIQAAIDAGYQAVIIDSLSHAWQNVLDRKGKHDRDNPRSNGYTNWKIFGAEWEKLIRFILDAPIHVFATSRSKQAYELITNDNGKKTPEKLGMAPQIREGTEYEYALVFDLLPSHKARVTKDNTGRFDKGEGVLWDLCDGSVGAELRDWLAGAVPVARPTPETCAAIDDAIRALPEAKQTEARQRWAARRDKGVTEEEAQTMLAALTKPRKQQNLAVAGSITPAATDVITPETLTVVEAAKEILEAAAERDSEVQLVLAAMDDTEDLEERESVATRWLSEVAPALERAKKLEA